jgi:glycosyltransferase involved in cell wall biosynthesis
MPMRANKPSLSFCLAAYNEEENVAAAIEQAIAVGRAGGYDFEILVCDDGSTDRTAVIVQQLAMNYPELRLVQHERNRGIIDTFETLYRTASKQYVFTNASDLQVPMEAVNLLLPLLDRCDIVVGQRRDKYYGLWRGMVSGLFNLLPPLLFGTPTYDAGTVKLWPRALAQSLRWVSRSPFREAERLIRAARAGYRVLQVSIPHYPRRAGKSSGAKASLVLAAAVDVIWTWVDIFVLRTPDSSGSSARCNWGRWRL